MREIAVRDYRFGDWKPMSHLDTACFPEAFRFDWEAMREFAESSNAIVVIGEKSDGGIAGFVIVHIERVAGRVRGYVVTLDVAPDCRREGIASELMREAERRANAAGARSMELHVFTGNEGAIRFYERMGYEQAGLRKGFYGARGQAQGALDAYVYRKDLASM